MSSPFDLDSGWPPAPPRVVPKPALPAQPVPARIKVLHVLTKLWGGAGGNTLLSATGMDPDRYEVWVAGGPDGHWDLARSAGIKTVELPRFREVVSPADDAEVMRDLVRLIRRERFSIVHTHMSKGGFLGRAAAKVCGTAVVIHTFHGFSFHEFMSDRRRRFYIGLERLAAPLADHYVAVSPRVAREAVERRIAPPGRISVVPSAVELGGIPEGPDPTVKDELGIPAGSPLVGTVGRIVQQKGPLDFIRMAARVSEVRPDVRFVWVGEGTFGEVGLERQAKEEAKRVGAPILFTGYRPDAARLASAFDVFVISSLYEGLGRSLTEALASGRPVVATAVNGVPDLVESGATGLLANPGNPESLATAVLWMLDHPEAAREMGRNGQVRVRGSFEPARMCALLDGIYCRLLGISPTLPGGIRRAEVVGTRAGWRGSRKTRPPAA